MTNYVRAATWLWATFAFVSSASAFHPNQTPNYGVGGRECITCHTTASGGNGCASPPCLNVFGNAFNANGDVWNFTLANQDSDGDGFTNGVEFLDRWGQWDIGDPAPGQAAYVTNPAAYNASMSECSLGTVLVDGWTYAYNNCSTHASCSETSGQPGFSCACSTGFMGNGVSCTDVDECATNNGGCSTAPMVTCTNSAGSFSCGACPSGYTGNGVTCTDVNECATSNGGCDPLATCTNNAGAAATCGACPSGYTGTGATACVDVDECATSNGGCDPLATCTNNAGAAATCGACPSGYTGTGATACVDVDECATSNGGCDPLRSCSNNVGATPTCGPCPAGYVDASGTGCTPVPADAGVDAGPDDAGPDDAGAGDAGQGDSGGSVDAGVPDAPSSAGGCACQTAGGRSRPIESVAWLALMAVALFVRRTTVRRMRE